MTEREREKRKEKKKRKLPITNSHIVLSVVWSQEIPAAAFV